MKSVLLASFAAALATPALAHSDGSMHTHGVELFLGLAAIGLVAAWIARP